MANKTLWKPGQSGNPSGRPPKSRALTDILATAGNAQCRDAENKPIARKKLLALMLWDAAISGQITFLATNREPVEDEDKPKNKTVNLRPDGWLTIVFWLFAQIDGDLSVTIDESKSGDDAATPPADAAPRAVVILPDNGRSVQRPASEEAEKQAPQAGTSGASECEVAPQQSGANGAD